MMAYAKGGFWYGGGGTGGGTGTFAVTDITGQTDDTTPATTATAVLAQGGSLIESTLAQIGTAIGFIDWTSDQGATTLGTPSANGSYVEWPITSRTVYKGETSCVLAYTQPTDGLQGTSENDMATFDDLAASTTNAPALSTGTPTASMSNSNGTSSASNTNGGTVFR